LQLLQLAKNYVVQSFKLKRYKAHTASLWTGWS